MATPAISKNSNIAKVPAKLDIDFFYKWLSFLQPFHKLSNKEMEVLSAFLKKRHELVQLVRDENVLDNLLKSIDVRKEIRESIGMNISQFNILCTKLRKTGALTENKINKRYIPNIEFDSKEYRLIIIFDLNDKN